jgi:hypothetical protein
MEMTYNDVLLVPGCPACGPALQSHQPELYFDVATLLNEDPRWS